MSLQTMSDIQRLLNSLIELNAMVTEENPAFFPEVDLHSLLTLLVENLFAEMRGGSTDTPQVLDFARRFSSSSRELMKRLSKCNFNYFTSTKSYYSRPHCAISFKDLPQMPKLEKKKLPSATMVQMREWKQQYRQSVRQQSVRNMSTEDRPGTLPVNAYEDETVNTEMFDFSVLRRDPLLCSSAQDNIEISQRSKDAETLDMPCIVAKKGEFAAVKHDFAPKGLASKPCPFFLVQFQEDILESVPIKRYDCLWFLKDLLPFRFTESAIGNTTVVSQGILEYSIPCEDVEEGTAMVEKEWYKKTMFLALDEGDTTTTTERALIA